jgi:hypothetical protein
VFGDPHPQDPVLSLAMVGYALRHSSSLCPCPVAIPVNLEWGEGVLSLWVLRGVLGVVGDTPAS